MKFRENPNRRWRYGAMASGNCTFLVGEKELDHAKIACMRIQDISIDKLLGGKRMLLNIKQAAGELGISEVTVRRLIRLRRIPYRKIGGIYRFTEDDLAQFIATVRVPSAQEARQCDKSKI
jgi:excisionase family DNA binding protein